MSSKDKDSVIDIADFFTAENEESGVWLEPELADGIKTGYEILLVGFNSKDAEDGAAEYQKNYSTIEAMEDSADKTRKLKEIVAKRASVFIKDIRGVDGKKLLIKGEPLEFTREIAEQMCLKSMELSAWIMRTLNNSATFMKVKKQA